MKDEVGGRIMAEYAALRPKTNSYLWNNNNEIKNAKNTKKCVIKQKLNFEVYKQCLEATQTENKLNQWEKIKLI